MHDVLIVSVPLITILAGLFFNRSEMQALRAEMRIEIKDLRAEINARFDRVDAELRYFHGVMGKHEARLEALEKG